MPQLHRPRVGSDLQAAEVKLRKVIPIIPSTEPEKSQLMDDLTYMGCAGFALKPWDFREEHMVRELLGKLSNEFDNTSRGVLG